MEDAIDEANEDPRLVLKLKLTSDELRDRDSGMEELCAAIEEEDSDKGEDADGVLEGVADETADETADADSALDDAESEGRVDNDAADRSGRVDDALEDSKGTTEG